MTCPVCGHPHVRMVNELLNSAHPLERIAMFYELDVHALRDHQVKCLASLGGDE